MIEDIRDTVEELVSYMQDLEACRMTLGSSETGREHEQTNVVCRPRFVHIGEFRSLVFNQKLVRHSWKKIKLHEKKRKIAEFDLIIGEYSLMLSVPLPSEPSYLKETWIKIDY